MISREVAWKMQCSKLADEIVSLDQLLSDGEAEPTYPAELRNLKEALNDIIRRPMDLTNFLRVLRVRDLLFDYEDPGLWYNLTNRLKGPLWRLASIFAPVNLKPSRDGGREFLMLWKEGLTDDIWGLLGPGVEHDNWLREHIGPWNVEEVPRG